MKSSLLVGPNAINLSILSRDKGFHQLDSRCGILPATKVDLKTQDGAEN